MTSRLLSFSHLKVSFEILQAWKGVFSSALILMDAGDTVLQCGEKAAVQKL